VDDFGLNWIKCDTFFYHTSTNTSALRALALGVPNAKILALGTPNTKFYAS